ncbi:MAG: urease accessory protein UreD [Chloroflexota bacterium]|nr:urease accessory protein UreD [Chloroflexota bacterium]
MLSSALPSGAGIQQGVIDLTLAKRGERTRLAQVRSRPPLQVQQALHPDSGLPDMALVMLSNPTGGIFQGDRHRIAVKVEPGAMVHVTGQGATRIHTMPDESACQDVELVVADGGYLEYLPDPVIPYRDSDFQQRTTLTVASGGKLIYWDIITPGRVAMGESFRYRRFHNKLEVMDCGGHPVYREAFSLNPARGLSPGCGIFSGRLGTGPGCTLGSMLVILPGTDFRALSIELQDLVTNIPDVAAGAGLLPNRVGVGVRVLGNEATEVRNALTQCWAAARKHLLGASLPFLRKY